MPETCSRFLLSSGAASHCGPVLSQTAWGQLPAWLSRRLSEGCHTPGVPHRIPPNRTPRHGPVLCGCERSLSPRPQPWELSGSLSPPPLPRVSCCVARRHKLLTQLTQCFGGEFVLRPPPARSISARSRLPSAPQALPRAALLAGSFVPLSARRSCSDRAKLCFEDILTPTLRVLVSDADKTRESGRVPASAFPAWLWVHGSRVGMAWGTERARLPGVPAQVKSSPCSCPFSLAQLGNCWFSFQTSPRS